MSKRRKISDIRMLERARVAALNDPGVYLDNPDASPAFDRHRPIPSEQKALAFGMEPTGPKRLWQLPAGDAGAGQTVFRRTQVFYPLAVTAPPLLADRVGGSPYSKAIGLATDRSADQRPHYFHVSIYGIGVRRPDLGPDLPPLSEGEIESLQFESIYTELAPGVFIERTPRFIPSVPTCQVRLMVHDESGQRFFDADVIGNRSFNIFAWGVTVFVLVKEGGYEVDRQNPDNLIDLNGGGIGVEDDIIGGRIVPIFRNRTESIQNRTISVRIDPNDPPGSLDTVVPIPPGTRKVQIFADIPVPAASWRLQFWYGRMPVGTRADMGIIDFNAGQSRTSIIDVPNSSAIAFAAEPEAPITNFILVFEVEP